jgi:hypothetical protein
MRTSIGRVVFIALLNNEQVRAVSDFLARRLAGKPDRGRDSRIASRALTVAPPHLREGRRRILRFQQRVHPSMRN